jgi:hypothetical protein
MDDIDGGLGDDFISGNDGADDLSGNDGDDLIFGGLGSDYLRGDLGNDILVPGPDGEPNYMQCVDGGGGNDITTVFVSQTTGCLVINDGGGNDLVNLIGFGPYSAQHPFGQTGFADDWVYLVDPIGGGDIFISVDETTDGGIEVINGLLSPNVTIVDILPPECQIDS